MPKVKRKDYTDIPEAAIAPPSKLSKTVAKVKKAVTECLIERSPTTDRVRFRVPPEQKKSRAVYRIEDTTTGRVYVGKTEGVGKRMTKHTSDIHQRRMKGELASTEGLDLYRDLDEDPEKFLLHLREVGPGEDLDKLERAEIKCYNSHKNGYNKNSGGGGGYAIDEDGTDFIPPEDPITTPEKTYPIKRGRVFLTPQTSQDKFTVYLVIDRQTGRRYVGSTAQKLSKRMADHISASKNPNSKAYGRELMQAFREGKNTKGRFEVAVLFRGENLREARQGEAHFIKLQTAKHVLLNKNKGMRAPLAPKRIKLL